mmetsp:Transcript_3907/g.12925  ORF Transcript_3907/g.12925 Transcript_3907/m.12925 type:complete len:280 (-) Transcript_3907:1056-1895(-)
MCVRGVPPPPSIEEDWERPVTGSGHTADVDESCSERSSGQAHLRKAPPYLGSLGGAGGSDDSNAPPYRLLLRAGGAGAAAACGSEAASSSSPSPIATTGTRCHELLLRPRKFQMPATLSGWLLCAASVALQMMVVAPSASATGTSASQKVHAHARSGGCSEPSASVALCQLAPPSAETSTRTMPRPPPLHATPRTSTGLPASSFAFGRGSAIIDCTGISCIVGVAAISSSVTEVTDGPKTLYARPRFHMPGASSSASWTSVSHFTCLTPTWPGTSTRSG